MAKPATFRAAVEPLLAGGGHLSRRGPTKHGSERWLLTLPFHAAAEVAANPAIGDLQSIDRTFARGRSDVDYNSVEVYLQLPISDAMAASAALMLMLDDRLAGRGPLAWPSGTADSPAAAQARGLVTRTLRARVTSLPAALNHPGLGPDWASSLMELATAHITHGAPFGVPLDKPQGPARLLTTMLADAAGTATSWFPFISQVAARTLGEHPDYLDVARAEERLAARQEPVRVVRSARAATDCSPGKSARGAASGLGPGP